MWKRWRNHLQVARTPHEQRQNQSLTKYYQTAGAVYEKNILQQKGIYLRNVKLILHLKINQDNLPH